MTSIEFDGGRQVWLLRTSATSYVIARDAESDQLLDLYWGPRLHLGDAAHLAGMPRVDRRRTAENGFDGYESYPVEGGTRFGPSALSVRFSDGVRAIEPEFVRHEIVREGNAQRLELVLRDRTYPLEIRLVYQVYEDGDVIDRWVRLRHTGSDSGTAEGSGPILVRHAYSAAWSIPHRHEYRLSRLHGRWGAETQLDRVRLSPSADVVLSSRTGTTSHQSNPWFAIDDGTATEEAGEVWSGALAWSGAWEIVARRYPDGRAQVSGGLGHPEFDLWTLKPGAEFETPIFSGLYANAGFGAVSRAWHDYQLRHVLPRSDETRPVLYNSWEATFFDIDEENQKRLAHKAAELGVELFVMDDGWFGGRVDDHAGLGDWWPNPERFPNGLTPLAEEVHGLGMQFGIWVEPEMVNPDSELYREHPDWVYHWPTRRRSEYRNQLVLNFAREDVRRWAYGWLDDLLSKNPIDYVKWDMNRPISEAGWPDELEHPERLWVEHVRGLYDILDRLRAAHPKVAFETCTGGGGRVDFGILRRTDMAWTSDNTDGYDRLTIQHGFTQIYAPRVMSAWVTDSPDHINGRKSSLRWRFHVAMAGLLGVGGDLTAWTDAELDEARELVQAYKRIRSTVQHGRLYRLRPPVPGETSAVEYVARDGSEVVVLAYLSSGRFRTTVPPLRLQGLDPAARYRNTETGEVTSGALLAGQGIPLDLRGDFDSVLVQLVRESDA